MTAALLIAVTLLAADPDAEREPYADILDRVHTGEHDVDLPFDFVIGPSGGLAVDFAVVNVPSTQVRDGVKLRNARQVAVANSLAWIPAREAGSALRLAFDEPLKVEGLSSCILNVADEGSVYSPQTATLSVVGGGKIGGFHVHIFTLDHKYDERPRIDLQFRSPLRELSATGGREIDLELQQRSAGTKLTVRYSIDGMRKELGPVGSWNELIEADPELIRGLLIPAMGKVGITLPDPDATGEVAAE